MGAFLQIAFIKYDFIKNTIKIKDKNYINVEKFYDNAKKQFDEQRLISGYFNCFENYDFINSIDNLSFGHMYEVKNRDSIMPKNLFGKKLLENTKGGAVLKGEPHVKHFMRFFMENIYSEQGIINHVVGSADNYKLESLKKICGLFYKVAETLSDGLLRDDKLIELKMLD